MRDATTAHVGSDTTLSNQKHQGNQKDAHQNWQFRTVKRTAGGITLYGICDVGSGDPRFVLKADSLDELRTGVQQLTGAIASPPIDYDTLIAGNRAGDFDGTVPTSNR